MFYSFGTEWSNLRSLSYIYPTENYMGLTVYDENNTSTRPRSFWTDTAVIITSIVTSCVPYIKVYFSWCKRSAIVFIFGLIYKSRTTGSNLDDTIVDLVCMVYVVCPSLWKKRSSPGYNYPTSLSTLDTTTEI